MERLNTAWGAIPQSSTMDEETREKIKTAFKGLLRNALAGEIEDVAKYAIILARRHSVEDLERVIVEL